MAEAPVELLSHFWAPLCAIGSHGPQGPNAQVCVSVFGASIVTEVLPVVNYWPAEDYHQDYYEQHPNQGYCAYVVSPKVAKLRKNFAALLK